MRLKLFTVCLLATVLFSSSLADREADLELLKWEPPEELTKSFPYYLCGLDEAGSEVWLVESAKWDIREITTEGGERLENLRKYYRQMLTRMGFKGRESKQSHQEAVVISNMDGLTNERAFHGKTLIESLNIARELVKIVREGGFKKGYYVNANAVFQAVLSLIRPIVGDLANHVEVYGTNTESWFPKLLKQIPKSQLPPFLGGDKDHKFLAIYG